MKVYSINGKPLKGEPSLTLYLKAVENDFRGTIPAKLVNGEWVPARSDDFGPNVAWVSVR